MSPDEFEAEFRRLSTQVDGALSFLKEQVKAYAQAEADYRKARSEAWVRVDRELLAKHQEAWVDAQSADLRRDRDIADGMRQASLEAVRSRRGQLSALQSLAAMQRAEMELARTGP